MEKQRQGYASFWKFNNFGCFISVIASRGIQNGYIVPENVFCEGWLAVTAKHRSFIKRGSSNQEVLNAIETRINRMGRRGRIFKEAINRPRWF